MPYVYLLNRSPTCRKACTAHTPEARRRQVLAGEPDPIKSANKYAMQVVYAIPPITHKTVMRLEVVTHIPHRFLSLTVHNSLFYHTIPLHLALHMTHGGPVNRLYTTGTTGTDGRSNL